MNFSKDDTIALIGTIIIHVILLIVLYLSVLRIFIPNAEEGIYVNFGDGTMGFGEFEPQNQVAGRQGEIAINNTEPTSTPPAPLPATATQQPAVTTTPPATSKTKVTTQKEEIVTQEQDETINVAVDKKKDTEATKKRIEEDRKKAEEEAKRKAEEQRKNELAMQERKIGGQVSDAFNRSSQASRSSGTGSGTGPGSGDRNIPGLAENSSSRGQGNEPNGTGNQGSPFGNSGSGANEGIGGTGTFSLSGRTLREGGLQRPAYSAQEEGQIVLNITVDPSGNVIFAEVGKGTNIDDASMRKNAIEAAKKAKFNKIKETNNQNGTITYKYRFL
jgi:TonB family protein